MVHLRSFARLKESIAQVMSLLLYTIPPVSIPVSDMVTPVLTCLSEYTYMIIYAVYPASLLLGLVCQ